jgi:hypothetical protein
MASTFAKVAALFAGGLKGVADFREREAQFAYMKERDQMQFALEEKKLDLEGRALTEQVKLERERLDVARFEVEGQLDLGRMSLAVQERIAEASNATELSAVFLNVWGQLRQTTLLTQAEKDRYTAEFAHQVRVAGLEAGYRMDEITKQMDTALQISRDELAQQEVESKRQADTALALPGAQMEAQVEGFGRTVGQGMPPTETIIQKGGGAQGPFGGWTIAPPPGASGGDGGGGGGAQPWKDLTQSEGQTVYDSLSDSFDVGWTAIEANAALTPAQKKKAFNELYFRHGEAAKRDLGPALGGSWIRGQRIIKRDFYNDRDVEATAARRTRAGPRRKSWLQRAAGAVGAVGTPGSMGAMPPRR